MTLGRYWTRDHEERECDVEDVNGSLAYVYDFETGERDWVPVDDVEPGAIDDWFDANSQFGVGA